MKKFPIIGIVGLQASGKTVVASHLTDLGGEKIRMGNIVWDEVKKQSLEITERNVGRVAKELREEEGMDAVAKRCVPLIKEKSEGSKTIIVDGIRGIAEVESFREEFEEDFFLISVKASEETRFKRIKRRKREDDSIDFEEFEKKESREMEWGLEEAMESADYRIVNEESLEELKKKTSQIFDRIMEKYEN